MSEDPQYPSLTQTGIPAENKIRGPVKVILLGNSNVGKSSIIAYLKDNVSTDQKTQMSTIRGPALPVGDVRVSTDSGDVKLSFWDTCGTEKYLSVTPQFMRGAKAVIFVYDISDRESLDYIFEGHGGTKSWIDLFQENCSWKEFKTIPVAVLGNKSDLGNTKRQLPTETVKQKLSEEAEQRGLNEFLFWETSAKTGDNLEAFSKALAERFPHHSEIWQTGMASANSQENSAAPVKVGNQEQKQKESSCAC